MYSTVLYVDHIRGHQSNAEQSELLRRSLTREACNQHKELLQVLEVVPMKVMDCEFQRR